MKNLTLALDEKSLKAARIYAAEHDTTVNALVREFLDGLVGRQQQSTTEERTRARKKLVELAEKSPGRLGDWKWNREDIYAERFSRYEYPSLRRYGEGDQEGRSSDKDR